MIIKSSGSGWVGGATAYLGGAPAYLVGGWVGVTVQVKLKIDLPTGTELGKMVQKFLKLYETGKN